MARPSSQSEPVRRLVDVNVVGTIACGVHALWHMVRRGRGAVVNVTSAEQMGKTSSAVYGATKAAVAALTYSWSEDMRGHGVRVNAVSPNAHTRMAEIYQAYRGVAGSQNAGLSPGVNAPLVVYLLSDLSAAVTGQVVRMQGSELMLCTHPAVLDPVVHRAEWTVEAVADAFDTDLVHRLQPVGVHHVRQSAEP